VSWKREVNRALARATGLELRRARPTAPPRRRARSGARLVRQPTFVLCTLRSGSTLLRVLLDSHSQLHSPHEIHLRYISAAIEKQWAARSMKEMGLDEQGLTYLLWDRILDRELTASGKPQLVTKTPNDVFIVDRIHECWPDARFIFLLRHPAMIARSRAKYIEAGAETDEKNVALIQRYCEALEDARSRYDGLTVRYEDLTADPAAQCRRITDFLGVAWEPGMLDYGAKDHGRFKSGLGDWAEKIRTGQVQPGDPLPSDDEVPEPLRDVARRWGYLPAVDRIAPAPAGERPPA
jgi:hypothetical protein